MSIREFERQRQSRAPVASYRVYPFLEWCRLNGFSKSTGQRLIRAGKVKITRLSPRRIGIREDHNAEYQAACIRESA